MSETQIELKNVSRYFDAGTASAGLVRAVDDVTFSIDRGESVALVGPSGSGKSTILNMIGAIDFATAGKVTVCSRHLTSCGEYDTFRNHSVGFVFQLFHLIAALTLVENIELALMPRRITPKDRRRRALELLERVGMQHRALALPADVSGGERQRAAIARALVTDPEIVLADEPTGNLDSASGRSVLQLLQEVTTSVGKTLVLVTHNEAHAKCLSRVISIEDGKIRS